MARGRPNSDEPTCGLAVRVPLALREQLDRSLDALETRVGLKASRNELIRQALRQCLEAEQHQAQPKPPQHGEAP
jgi:metal-responsive CopG/Arc/MetJ family transcriptional regulator